MGGETEKDTTPSNRKKRLSRKEQRRRKKQKLRATTGEADTALPTKNDSSSSSIKKDAPSSLCASASVDFSATYVPTPIPQEISTQANEEKSLGKWFPKAIVLKSSSTNSSCEKGKISPASTSSAASPSKSALVLFYQYVSGPSLWSESRVNHLMKYLAKIGQVRGLGGRIRVAPEGVNATVSSIDNSSTSAIETLHHFAKDLQQFDKLFDNTHFKYIQDLSPDRHFKDFKILPVKELVFYGLDSEQAPLDKGGTHLLPNEFHKMLSQKETVVVDVRNHYEAAIGRFDGQEHQEGEEEEQQQSKDQEEENTKSKQGGAKYIDPKMRKSTDFPGWLKQPETENQLKDKNVLLYCTGGVRCERASAFLNKQMGDKLKGVYQLQGGIENYLQSFPDGGYWRGKNFVFDKREAISVDNKDGDGGVVRKKKNTKGKSQSNDDNKNDIQATCCVCDTPWDRYIGKKKCETCGVPVLMCDKCMSNSKNKNKKNEKSSQAAKELLIRCPLCKEQDVTIKADNVTYTNNGVTGTVVDYQNNSGNSLSRSDGNGKKNKNSESGKAAPSVLKWGGGHGHQKKERRRFQRIPCRFGADCVRKDCFFSHPDTGRTKT